MKSSPHDRVPRCAPAQDVFNRRVLETVSIPAGSWINLRWAANAKNEQLFFASPSGRLTPWSGKIPCLYLSPTERTSFREIYGDTVALAENDEEPALIEANDLSLRVFLDIAAPAMVLADITTGKGLEAVGLDVTTVTHTVIDFPRKWAQAIYDHPQRVDGIYYESRHTKELCIVVWQRSPSLLFGFSNPRTLGSRSTFLPNGNIGLFGSELMIVS